MAGRTLPGLGLTGDWNLGEDNWKDANDVNLVTLSTLVQARVLSIQTVLPAGVEGAVYLCSPTHATQPNKVAAYDEGAWKYFAPFEGMQLYNVATSKRMIYQAGAWAEIIALTSAPKFRLGFSIENATPIAAEVMLRHVFTSAVNFADDFAGSRARLKPAGANPATNQVFSILHNGVAVGSLTISNAGVVTFATTGGALAVAAGDELRIDAPAAPDANLVGVSVTLLGTE